MATLHDGTIVRNGRMVIMGRPGTVDARDLAQNDDERAVLAHLRLACHDSRTCALCDAEWRAHEAGRILDTIIEG